MKIGELGHLVGTDPATIRFYERQRLLPAPARSANGYRTYTPAHLERLVFVRHCRALDMPLADIRHLIQSMNMPGRDCADINRLVDKHLQQLRARIKSMHALEEQLAMLRAQCPTTGTIRDCGILTELSAAAQGAACACHHPASTRVDDAASGNLQKTLSRL